MVMKQSVGTITDLLIATTYPHGNDNNTHRTSQLIKSGAMRIETMQYKRCKSRLDENLEILQFKIDVAPSMKSKVRNESVNSSEHQLDDRHTLFLYFDIHAKNYCIIRVLFLAVMMVVTFALILLDFYF